MRLIRIDILSVEVFQRYIPSGPLRSLVAVYWPLFGVPPGSTMPQSYALALLFMLHLRYAVN